MAWKSGPSDDLDPVGRRAGVDRAGPAWCKVTRDAHERFRRDYAPAFLQYLSERAEPGLKAAYELGRRAIGERLSVLDLARIHHTMLLDVLKTHRTSHELEHIAEAASEFLVEALAVFEMTQRGFVELRDGLEPRITVEQATGIVMERHGLTPDAAAEWIRQAAARQGITLDEAAARLLRPQPPGPQGRSG
jgi:hypothetical protein